MPITLTIQKAAQESGLAVRTIYKLLAEARLKSVRVGRRRLILWRSLQDLLSGRAASRE